MKLLMSNQSMKNIEASECFEDLVPSDTVPLSKQVHTQKKSKTEPSTPKNIGSNGSHGDTKEPTTILQGMTPLCRDGLEEKKMQNDLFIDYRCCPGINNREMKKLKASNPDEEIDLHGFTCKEAYMALDRFLAVAISDGVRIVRVIHGRGAHSPENNAILKASVWQWLKESPSQYILAVVEAKGNSGAANILLKNQENKNALPK